MAVAALTHGMVIESLTWLPAVPLYLISSNCAPANAGASATVSPRELVSDTDAVDPSDWWSPFMPWKYVSVFFVTWSGAVPTCVVTVRKPRHWSHVRFLDRVSALSL